MKSMSKLFGVAALASMFALTGCPKKADQAEKKVDPTAKVTEEKKEEVKTEEKKEVKTEENKEEVKTDDKKEEVKAAPEENKEAPKADPAAAPAEPAPAK